ncbi:serine/threonine protein kinase [Bacillus sp. T3]|uniref:serine/threonine protein kinase n=1 Tax=Bacillus sp. T3 TaxID=467262 RepID=UPI0029827310|nr:protein kinase [Bacillus sp. T3]
MYKSIILIISSLIEKPLANATLIQNRYEVLSHLGSGSYGHSYLVFDHQDNVKVVLKALRWHKRMTKKGRIGFYQEMAIMQQLHYPSFPRFIGHGMYDKVPFFTMEYISGKTFEQLIFEEGRQFDELESFTLGYELVKIFSFLQQNNIVHRDIRIPNIMWDGDQIKVIDLGLAKKVAGGTIENQKSIIHPRKQIDFKSDFYGLGHFLLFLLYSAYSPDVNEKEKSWEEELTLSYDAKSLIRKLLQIDPPYETTQQLKCDFEKILKSYAITEG